jgi:hypothetical protein
LLFSAQTQFVVESGDLLTPKTIAVKQTTEFENAIQAKPVGVGKNIYFAVPKGEYSGMREYFTIDDVSGTNDSTDITSHVPSYVPKNVYKVAPCLTEDLLVVLSKEQPSNMFIYKFFFNGQEKLQSSWSKWTLNINDAILNADFILSDLLLVIQMVDGVYLEKLSVATGDIGANEPYTVHLDRKLTVPKSSLTYDGAYTNIPVANLPGVIDIGNWEAVVATGQPKTAGIRLPIQATPTGGKILGNYTDCDLVVGRKYNFRYAFSPITVKQQAGNAQKSDTVGRLQLRTMQINYSNTGYFKANVKPSGRDGYEYIYSGKTIGLSSATIGVVDLDTGKMKFPILSQNTGVDIELSSDSPLPCSFLSADWEGMYVKRSKGM